MISGTVDMPMASGLGADLSPAALKVAAENAAAHGLGPRARFVQSDWFSAIPGRYDLIVSNPPYIAADEMAALAPEVRDHEPHLALFGGDDGLDAVRVLLAELPPRLLPGAPFLFEIGYGQAREVSGLVEASPAFALEDVRLDAAGSREKPGVRVIVAPNDPARTPATATKAPEDK